MLATSLSVAASSGTGFVSSSVADSFFFRILTLSYILDKDGSEEEALKAYTEAAKAKTLTVTIAPLRM